MPNRRRQWQDFLIDSTVVINGQTGITLLQGGVDDTKGMTLVRMIIGLDLYPELLVTLSIEASGLNLGIGMMSAEAIASGQFPDPDIATDIPLTGWLWRWSGVVHERMQGDYRRIDQDLRS